MPTQPFPQPQTGNANLRRHHPFNHTEEDIDVPDGDLEYGRSLYKDLCQGCHNYIFLGPNLISIFGSKGGQQREFTKYSSKTRTSLRWSKQRLFRMLQCPEEMFGMDSAMLFQGYKDPYMRASIIEYMQYMRLTHPLAVKPRFYMQPS